MAARAAQGTLVKKLLQTLTEALCPSGYEDEVREIVHNEIKSLVDEIRVDPLGSLVARKCPGKIAKNTKKIMVAARMDEVGLAVRHVDESGFIRFSPIGSIPRRYVPGDRVRFLNGARGVIAVGSSDKVAELPMFDQIYIDVGATSRDDCLVKVGDLAVFDGSYQEFGNRLVAKSMDDRVGILIAIETLRSLKSASYDVYFVFTTRHAGGTGGALPSAYGIDPDLGIALDVTPAEDAPLSRGAGIALGKGPCIKIQDACLIADPRIVNWMIGAAEKNKIPYQREVSFVEGSDVGAIQYARAGVPSGCISIPVRYVHSSSEMVETSDVQSAVKLLKALLHTQIEL